MKKCSYCGAEYPDDVVACLVDETPLGDSHWESVTIPVTMSVGSKISFKVRIGVFVGLWLIANLIWANFAGRYVEAGESEFAARAEMVYFAPLSAADGLAFVVAHDGSAHAPLQDFLSPVFLCAFLAHGWIAACQ